MRPKPPTVGGSAAGSASISREGAATWRPSTARIARPTSRRCAVWLKKPAGHTITFRYTDQTGQTFQRPVFVLDDRWCDVLIGIEGFALHWGGANDGIIHGPPMLLSFGIDNAGARTGSLLLDDLRLIEGRPGTAAGVETVELTAYRFDAAEQWSLRGRGTRRARGSKAGRSTTSSPGTRWPSRSRHRTVPCSARR